MNVGDIVKSKSTGKLYKVIEQKSQTGFVCTDDDGSKYYFFESEVDVVQNTNNTAQPNSNDIANALITIQTDLLNCKNSLELGQKYKNYSELLNQFLLKGIEKLCNKAN